MASIVRRAVTSGSSRILSEREGNEEKEASLMTTYRPFVVVGIPRSRVNFGAVGEFSFLLDAKRRNQSSQKITAVGSVRGYRQAK